MAKFRFIFILLLFSIGHPICSQNDEPKDLFRSLKRPDLLFNNIRESDGLPFNILYAVVTDNNGFMWLGTGNGLCRFDGKRFDIFKRNRKDKTSIINNTIKDLCIDKYGKIWGATLGGLFEYDCVRDQFINYPFHGFDRIPEPFAMISDSLGNIWFSTNRFGLMKYDISLGSYSSFQFSKNNVFSITSDNLSNNCIVADPGNKGIWIATNNGLNYLEFSSGKFSNYRNGPLLEIFDNSDFTTIATARDGNIWTLNNTTSELIKFDPKKRKILLKINISSHIKKAHGGIIFESSKNEIWYSSDSYETIRIRYTSGQIIDKIKYDPKVSTSISGDYSFDINEDADQTIWLCTNAGLSAYNEKNDFYNLIPIDHSYPELGQKNWEITAMAENLQTKEWWIGSRFGYVYIYNPQNGTSKKLDIIKGGRVPNNTYMITDIDFLDRKAVLALASGVAMEVDLKTFKISPFHSLKDKHPNFVLRAMGQETDSTYILSDNLLPLLRWYPATNQYEKVNFNDKVLSENKNLVGNWLRVIKDKGAWISSYKFPGFIPVGSDEIIAYNHHAGNEDQLPELMGGFNSLEIDDKANVWFSILGQGLFNVNKNSGKSRFWDSNDGLISENLQATLPDKFGKIWCADANKYSVYDPDCDRFHNFKIELSNNNSYYYNYMIPLSNDHILTNIKGTLIEFYPEKIKILQPQNRVLISSVEIPSGKKVLNESNKLLMLKPEDNFITINFGSLSNNKLFNYEFEYILEGVNKIWIKADNDAKAIYTNLSPGSYTFRVKAVSESGWESPEQVLMFRILTPFYKSWWFILLWLSVVSGVVLWVIFSRLNHIRNINHLKSKAQLLEKEKSAVMYENLKQHLNPHFLFNSLASLSSLIRIDPKQAGDFLDKMSKVYRYILKNKENDTVTLVDELKFVDMYIQLQKTRFQDSLMIEMNIPEAFHHRKIAPVTLQNLVENAIKHNIADVDAPLIIRFYIEDDYLIVQNTLNKKNFVETSNKQGQLSMLSLYRFLSKRPVIVEENEKFYIVKIPLL